MWIIKSIQYAIRSFLELDNDYQTLLSNQKELLEELKQLKQLEIQTQQTSYLDYLTLKNALWVLFFIGLIGSGFWLYNADFSNTNVLESIKSLSSLSKDLHNLDQQGIFDALKKLNENSVNLSKEEVKLLMEIKNLLMARGIAENPSLNRPVSTILYSQNGGIVWDDQS